MDPTGPPEQSSKEASSHTEGANDGASRSHDLSHAFAEAQTEEDQPSFVVAALAAMWLRLVSSTPVRCQIEIGPVGAMNKLYRIFSTQRGE
jgi:hypothetical protein